MTTSRASTFNYETGAVDPFTDGTINTDWTSGNSILGCCLLPPLSISGTDYPKGLVVISFFTGSAGVAEVLLCEVFNPVTGLRITEMSTSTTTNDGAAFVASLYAMCKAYPLGRGTPGYVFPNITWDTGDGTLHLSVVRPDGVSDFFTLFDVTDDGQAVLDISPIPRASRPAFHAAARSDSGTQPGLYFFFEEIDYSTGAGVIQNIWTIVYSNASWTPAPNAWTVEPTGVLAVVDVLPAGRDKAQTFAVIGVTGWDMTLGVYTCVSPRLAIVNGGVNGSGEVLGSTYDLSAGFVACATYDQFGGVFVGGKGSLVDYSVTDGSIERYVATPATTPGAGLWTIDQAARYSMDGSPFTGYPVCMIWDGARLLAFFTGTTNQWGLFDENLNLLTHGTLASTGEPGNNLTPTQAWRGVARSSQRFVGLVS